MRATHPLVTALHAAQVRVASVVAGARLRVLHDLGDAQLDVVADVLQQQHRGGARVGDRREGVQDHGGRGDRRAARGLRRPRPRVPVLRRLPRQLLPPCCAARAHAFLCSREGPAHVCGAV